MFGGKNPGLKILWLWTIGTAAVLVASVVTTRLRDMDKMVNNDVDAQPVRTDLIIGDGSEESE